MESRAPVKLFLTGGGTGGHTSTGLAIAAALRKRLGADLELLWIGSGTGIEARLAPEAGIPYRGIQTGKLRRYWAWANLTDLCFRVPLGSAQALGLLCRFRPHAVVSVGGFASLPVVVAARLLRLPILVHEQTAVSGLANRIGARLADRVAVSFEASAREFPAHKVVVTGNPIRPELLVGEVERARKRFGLEASLPLVYITGGAQGAHRVNRAAGPALPHMLQSCQIIHQCGKNVYGDHGWLQEEVAARLPAELQTRYHVLPYVEAELADIYAATALLVGRAGAGTVNEAIHLGLPACFIPLPGTDREEQSANARLMEEVGAAVIIPDRELTPERLAETVVGLLADPARLLEMGQRARSLARPDAAEILVRLTLELVTRRPGRAGAGSSRTGAGAGRRAFRS